MDRPKRLKQTRSAIPAKNILLNLPPEIRNHIYRLALVQVVPLKPNVRKLFAIAEEHEKTMEPYGAETTLSLARTCSQLHDEAIAVYYGENHFTFDGTYDLYTFLFMTSLERRQCIKAISFKYRGECQRLAFELLSDCTRLQKLDITVSRETTKGTRKPQMDIWKARGMSALRSIRGMENLDLTIQHARFERCYWSGLETPIKKHFSDQYITEVAKVLMTELRSDSLEAVPLEKDGAKKDGAKKDGAKKDGAKKDGAKKDGAKKDGAKKDGAKKDGAKKDGAKKDGAKKDGAKKDGAKKDGAKKDGAKKDGAETPL